MRFSKKTQCFYPDYINYPNPPDDLRPCPDDDFDICMIRPPGWVMDWKGGRVVPVEPPPKTLAEAKSIKIKEVAAARYEKEVSGVEYDGCTIATDRASVALLDSTLEKIRRGLVASVNWKCEGGKYLSLSASNAATVELAVLFHIQSCFEKERQIVEAINAMTDPVKTISYKVDMYD